MGPMGTGDLGHGLRPSRRADDHCVQHQHEVHRAQRLRSRSDVRLSTASRRRSRAHRCRWSSRSSRRRRTVQISRRSSTCVTAHRQGEDRVPDRHQCETGHTVAASRCDQTGTTAAAHGVRGAVGGAQGHHPGDPARSRSRVAVTGGTRHRDFTELMRGRTAAGLLLRLGLAFCCCCDDLPLGGDPDQGDLLNLISLARPKGSWRVFHTTGRGHPHFPSKEHRLCSRCSCRAPVRALEGLQLHRQPYQGACRPRMCRPMRGRARHRHDGRNGHKRGFVMVSCRDLRELDELDSSNGFGRRWHPDRRDIVRAGALPAR